MIQSNILLTDIVIPTVDNLIVTDVQDEVIIKDSDIMSTTLTIASLNSEFIPQESQTSPSLLDLNTTEFNNLSNEIVVTPTIQNNGMLLNTDIPVYDNAVPTDLSLNTNSPSNNDVLGSYESVNAIPSITPGSGSLFPSDPTLLPQINSLFELLQYLSEVMMRFNSDPNYYMQDDFAILVKTITNALIHLYLNAPLSTGEVEGLYAALGTKVDKILGKGLSTNDLTDELKAAYDSAFLETHIHNNKAALDLVSGENTGDQDLSGLQPKETGKGLSTNDFTNTDKTKLDGIQNGAEVNVNADWNAISGDALILNKPNVPSIVGLATENYVQNYAEPKKGTDDNYVTDIEKSNLHTPHSDDQDLSGLVVKIPGYSLVSNVDIAKIHLPHSDDQDLTPYETIVNNNIKLATKEPANSNIQAHIANTNNPHNTTKLQVGLGNVDNTSDIDKPISILTQLALDTKEPLISNGDVTQYWRGDKTFQTLDKNAVGLDQVDNTSDLNKPISTATQTALNDKEPANTNIQTHIASISNPHNVTKAQVGLESVPNIDTTNDYRLSNFIAGVNYNPALLYPSNPTGDTFLNDLGTFSSPPSSGGGSASGTPLYFLPTNSPISGYFELDYTPYSSVVEIPYSIPVGTTLLSSHLYDLEIATTTIDAGNWFISSRSKVNNLSGSVRLHVDFILYHIDGTETVLFGGDSETFNSTDFKVYSGQLPESSFSCVSTDRIGVKLYAINSGGATKTLTTSLGLGIPTFFSTPLRIRHSSLRDKNGEAAFQHLTSEQVSIVNSTSGTNTGDETKTTIQNKLGAASYVNSGYLTSLDWGEFKGKVTFPGFGTTHTTAAYGDHLHTGIYEVPLTFSTGLTRTGNTITNNITQYTDVLARAAQTNTSIITALGYTPWYSGNHPTTLSGYGITDAVTGTPWTSMGYLTGITSGQVTTALGYTPKPTFTENTAFNKNFGTTTGTVLEGRTFGTAANSAVGDFQPTITGLTTNYIPKWNGSSFVNSSITDGVNTTFIDKGNTYNILKLNSNIGDNSFSLWNNNVADWVFGTQVGEANQNFNFYNQTTGSISLSIKKSSNNIQITSTTQATSPTTGALVVNGGIGVGGTIYAGAVNSLAGLSLVNRYNGTHGGNLLFNNGTGQNLSIRETGESTYWFGGGNLGTNDSNGFLINTGNGNVNIGYTSDQGYKLAVNGTGYFNGNVTAGGFIKSGGTSSQFLKADGSVDATNYQPAITLTTNGTSGAATFSGGVLNVPNYGGGGGSGGSFTPSITNLSNVSSITSNFGNYISIGGATMLSFSVDMSIAGGAGVIRVSLPNTSTTNRFMVTSNTNGAIGGWNSSIYRYGSHYVDITVQSGYSGSMKWNITVTYY